MKIKQVEFEIEIELGKEEDPNEARERILGGLYDDVTTYLDETQDGYRLRLVFDREDDVPQVLKDTARHLGKIVS